MMESPSIDLHKHKGTKRVEGPEAARCSNMILGPFEVYCLLLRLRATTIQG